MTRDEEAAELRRVNRQNTIDAYKRLGKEPPPLEFDSEEQHKERAKAQAFSAAVYVASDVGRAAKARWIPARSATPAVS